MSKTHCNDGNTLRERERESVRRKGGHENITIMTTTYRNTAYLKILKNVNPWIIVCIKLL